MTVDFSKVPSPFALKGSPEVHLLRYPSTLNLLDLNDAVVEHLPDHKAQPVKQYQVTRTPIAPFSLFTPRSLHPVSSLWVISDTPKIGKVGVRESVVRQAEDASLPKGRAIEQPLVIKKRLADHFSMGGLERAMAGQAECNADASAKRMDKKKKKNKV